jgi:chromosome segregation protein
VYVKSLTLRGFKSFASATTLRFEPGITCVVGPNGSGKSNIVDAFAWVMGEQGARSLRGGRMEDVVFAGTTSRPPLGRAEVVLTIDNSDGALPIDYTEVTISRLLFRSGQSEYAINGNPCRLLDVAELLSDSGLGREMHVLVSQGQLDEVLHAGPEARRALIEEAAGVLKHRRRKEKALRKLEAMQANLTRLTDLTAEARRRLGPLGRQAALARRASEIQAELRDARLRLLADDYVGLTAALAQCEADEEAVRSRRAELAGALAKARDREAALDADQAELAPRLARAAETWFALSGLAERLRGIANLARERHAHLVAEAAPDAPAADPAELDRQAAKLREAEAELGERLEAARERLAAASAQRQAAEAELAAAERELATRARVQAQRAERLARLRGQVAAARGRVASAEASAERLGLALAEATARARAAEQEYQEFSARAARRQDERAGLAAAHQRAEAELAAASERTARCRAAERQASAERAGLAARVQALEEAASAARGSDAGAAVLADPAWSGKVLGAVAGLLTVSDGAREAISAALGGAADAIAVAGLDTAVRVLQQLRESGLGSAGLVIAGPAGANASPVAEQALAAGSLPPGVRPALGLVAGPPELAPALAGLLGDVVVAGDLDQARQVLAGHPELRVVTTGGDLLGCHWAHGGSARPPGRLVLRAAAEEAAAGLAAAEAACRDAAAALAEATLAEQRARQEAAAALARLQAADRAAAEESGRLGRLSGAARAAREEAQRLTAAIASAAQQAERDQAELAMLTARLAEAEASTGEPEQDAAQPAAGAQEPADRPGTVPVPADAAAGLASQQPERQAGATRLDREALAAQAGAARDAETEARLEVRTAEEQLRAMTGRTGELAAAAAAARQAAAAARARREQRARSAQMALAVARGADLACAAATASLALAAAEREAAEQSSRGRASALHEVRAQIRALAAELDSVVDRAHSAEVTRAERRMRRDQVAARAAEEFGVDPATLVAEYGPHLPVPVLASGAEAHAGPGQAPTGSEEAGTGPGGAVSREGAAEPAAGSGRGAGPRTVRYLRAEQEQRAAAAQRQLDRLGKVNPLALEEYAALEERHAFLAAQLEDLKKTRRDLLTVVKEVDDRVQQVFAAAFADTAAEFSGIFGRLFPGGEGRLVLTEPADMLATGIDVEARPPGKRVKRLSLLSGGERSLTALAFLLAIFKARPSPFYVLDEVEAALDDVNLRRLLGIFEELRDSSQLIIVTHQKPTMEIADALYGVTMAGDGVSTVVSQRLRAPQPA